MEIETMDGRVERDVRMETGGPGELDPRVPPPPGQTRLESSEDWLEDCLETATTKRENLMSGLQRNTISLNKSDDQKERKIASKPHSTPLTLKWLEENYEIAEGVCIPRSTLYMHYLDFCDKNDSQPVNAASFGKIIRQQFPHLTTRRLGTRGQSKYHYYGIGVKETSHYYDVMFSRKGIQECPEGKKHDIKQVVAYSPRSKLGTLLPEFPNVRDIKLPPGVAEDKVTSHTEVNTFLMMYRTHCQRILDTVIRANFDEVQQFLLHFWQGMPGHIVPILGTAPVISLVGVCDSILYKAISGVLMPTVLQALPDSLTQVIRKFARQLDEWLHIALEDLPEPLRQMKFDLARRFSQLLKRQTSLNHLCQASRTVIHSSEITSQMLEDWANVDLASISKQTLYTMDTFTDRELAIIECLYKEFETLLQEQAPIEAYTEWLDSMVDRCVVKPSQKKPGTVRRIARQFLLMWSCFGTRVIRDMTLHSAPSFGSFHLLHLMFDDYVLYLVESIHSNERASELLRAVKGEAPLVDAKDEMILPNPSIGSGGYSTTFHPNSPMSANMERQSVIQDTRDAYNQHYNKDSYAMSPHNPGANQSNSPSQSTSSMMSYDVRCENEATQESPPGDGTAHLSAAPMTGRTDTHGGQGDGYSRYLPMNTSSTQTGDAAYTYGPYNSNVQYGYNREYSGSRGSWTDTQRYSHTTPVPPATTQEVQSNYYNYPYPRGGGTEYDIHSYGYDENVYAAQSMRNQSQSSGAIYPAYGNAIDTYCAETETDSTSKKRKLASFDESGYPTKKTAEYDFSITAAGYQRA